MFNRFGRICLLVVVGLPLDGLAHARIIGVGDLLLAGRSGELCASCEAAVRCDPTAITESSRATIYIFHKKSIAGWTKTVLEFIPFIESDGWEQRPLTILRFGGHRIERDAEMAALSVRAAKIEVGPEKIDRRDGEWIGSDGSSLGLCREIDSVALSSIMGRTD